MSDNFFPVYVGTIVIMILSYEPSISLHIQMQCTCLVVPDMDSHVTCSTDMECHMTCKKTQFVCKLHAAARLPHWLPYMQIRLMMINRIIYSCTDLLFSTLLLQTLTSYSCIL